MHTVSCSAGLCDLLGRWRGAGESVAFVPTMGNLHAGHGRLVREARALGGRVVVSIFVNPLQFNDADDFRAYPRTVAEDERQLRDWGVDALFLPAVEEIYPRGMTAGTRVVVPGLSDILCGAHRPGHFTGVSTVVTVLLNIVQPDIAVFGEKDFQQLLIVRRLVGDLRLPVKIVGVETVREADGLAMSSRNRYLTDEERRRAPMLYQVLRQTRARILDGAQDYPALEAAGLEQLKETGFRPEYLSVRRAADLAVPEAGDRDLVVLAAAWLGTARLIDNLRVRRGHGFGERN